MAPEHGSRGGEAVPDVAVETHAVPSLAATDLARVHADSRVGVALQPDMRCGKRGGGRIQERGDLRLARSLEVLLVARRQPRHEPGGQARVLAADKVLDAEKDVSHTDVRCVCSMSIQFRWEVGIDRAALHVEAETTVDERNRNAEVEIVP